MCSADLSSDRGNGTGPAPARYRCIVKGGAGSSAADSGREVMGDHGAFDRLLVRIKRVGRDFDLGEGESDRLAWQSAGSRDRVVDQADILDLDGEIGERAAVRLAGEGNFRRHVHRTTVKAV